MQAARVRELKQTIDKGGTQAAAARFQLVRIFEASEDWQDAAEQLEALRSLAPANLEYAYQLGMVYRNMSRSAYLRLRAVAPGSARVMQLDAEQYVASGNLKKAVQKYLQAVAADPKLPGSHLGLAMLYAQTGKQDDAVTEINRELELVPDSVFTQQIKKSLLDAGR